MRCNIEQLESGLRIVDGGAERKTNAGFIDILCKDAQGRTVVIELKAGEANDAAIAQILSYMGALGEEGLEGVRGMIIASAFSRRSKYAAKTLPNVKLIRYRFSFIFEEPFD